MKVPVEVSARHVHLSQEAVDALFGKSYQLTFKRELSQPGQFLCNERVSVIGPKGSLENVAVLGPVRKETQVEISITDALKIGKKCSVRESGDLQGSEACVLCGPAGTFEIPYGLIIAKRHVHINPEQAKSIGVYDGQICSVKINSKERSAIYSDVVIRVNTNFALTMHIDTDEANAVGYKSGICGEMIFS